VREEPLGMAVYVILGNLTQKAIETAKGMAERDKKADQIIRAAGGKLLANHYTLGRYDFVAIVDLPSTEVLARILLEIGKWGTVTTETMMVLPPEEVYRAASSV
jgi:uncharacterized protein with GYD domain